MAGVAGEEVVYKKESRLGMTTLTYRSKRYTFPSVIVKGDLGKDKGVCIMLDIGLFCPFCTGSFKAKFVSSQSRLAIHKTNGKAESHELDCASHDTTGSTVAAKGMVVEQQEAYVAISHDKDKQSARIAIRESPKKENEQEKLKDIELPTGAMSISRGEFVDGKWEIDKDTNQTFEYEHQGSQQHVHTLDIVDILETQKESGETDSRVVKVTVDIPPVTENVYSVTEKQRLVIKSPIILRKQGHPIESVSAVTQVNTEKEVEEIYIRSTKSVTSVTSTETSFVQSKHMASAPTEDRFAQTEPQRDKCEIKVETTETSTKVVKSEAQSADEQTVDIIGSSKVTPKTIKREIIQISELTKTSMTQDSNGNIVGATRNMRTDTNMKTDSSSTNLAPETDVQSNVVISNITEPDNTESIEKERQKIICVDAEPDKTESVDKERQKSIDAEPDKIESIEEESQKIICIDAEPDKIESIEDESQKIICIDAEPDKIESIEEESQKIICIDAEPDKTESVEKESQRIICIDAEPDKTESVEKEGQKIICIDAEPDIIEPVEKENICIGSAPDKTDLIDDIRENTEMKQDHILDVKGDHVSHLEELKSFAEDISLTVVSSAIEATQTRQELISENDLKERESYQRNLNEYPKDTYHIEKSSQNINIESELECKVNENKQNQETAESEITLRETDNQTKQISLYPNSEVMLSESGSTNKDKFVNENQEMECTRDISVTLLETSVTEQTIVQGPALNRPELSNSLEWTEVGESDNDIHGTESEESSSKESVILVKTQTIDEVDDILDEEEIAPSTINVSASEHATISTIESIECHAITEQENQHITEIDVQDKSQTFINKDPSGLYDSGYKSMAKEFESVDAEQTAEPDAVSTVDTKEAEVDMREDIHETNKRNSGLLQSFADDFCTSVVTAASEAIKVITEKHATPRPSDDVEDEVTDPDMVRIVEALEREVSQNVTEDDQIDIEMKGNNHVSDQIIPEVSIDKSDFIHRECDIKGDEMQVRYKIQSTQKVDEKIVDRKEIKESKSLPLEHNAREFHMDSYTTNSLNVPEIKGTCISEQSYKTVEHPRSFLGESIQTDKTERLLAVKQTKQTKEESKEIKEQFKRQTEVETKKEIRETKEKTTEETTEETKEQTKEKDSIKPIIISNVMSRSADAVLLSHILNTSDVRRDAIAPEERSRLRRRRSLSKSAEAALHDVQILLNMVETGDFSSVDTRFSVSPAVSQTKHNSLERPKALSVIEKPKRHSDYASYTFPMHDKKEQESQEARLLKCDFDYEDEILTGSPGSRARAMDKLVDDLSNLEDRLSELYSDTLVSQQATNQDVAVKETTPSGSETLVSTENKLSETTVTCATVVTQESVDTTEHLKDDLANPKVVFIVGSSSEDLKSSVEDVGTDTVRKVHGTSPESKVSSSVEETCNYQELSEDDNCHSSIFGETVVTVEVDSQENERHLSSAGSSDVEEMSKASDIDRLIHEAVTRALECPDQNKEDEESVTSSGDEEEVCTKTRDPEETVDEILENVDTESYSPNATLSKVFTQPRSKKPKRPIIPESFTDTVVLKKKEQQELVKQDKTEYNIHKQEEIIVESICENETQEEEKTVDNSTGSQEIIKILNIPEKSKETKDTITVPELDREASPEVLFERIVEAISGEDSDLLSEAEIELHRKKREQVMSQLDIDFSSLQFAQSRLTQTRSSSCEVIPDDNSSLEVDKSFSTCENTSLTSIDDLADSETSNVGEASIDHIIEGTTELTQKILSVYCEDDASLAFEKMIEIPGDEEVDVLPDEKQDDNDEIDEHQTKQTNENYITESHLINAEDTELNEVEIEQYDSCTQTEESECEISEMVTSGEEEIIPDILVYDDDVKDLSPIPEELQDKISVGQEDIDHELTVDTESDYLHEPFYESSMSSPRSPEIRHSLIEDSSDMSIYSDDRNEDMDVDIITGVDSKPTKEVYDALDSLIKPEEMYQEQFYQSSTSLEKSDMDKSYICASDDTEQSLTETDVDSVKYQCIDRDVITKEEVMLARLEIQPLSPTREMSLVNESTDIRFLDRSRSPLYDNEIIEDTTDTKCEGELNEDVDVKEEAIRKQDTDDKEDQLNKRKSNLLQDYVYDESKPHPVGSLTMVEVVDEKKAASIDSQLEQIDDMVDRNIIELSSGDELQDDEIYEISEDENEAHTEIRKKETTTFKQEESMRVIHSKEPTVSETCSSKSELKVQEELCLQLAEAPKDKTITVEQRQTENSEISIRIEETALETLTATQPQDARLVSQNRQMLSVAAQSEHQNQVEVINASDIAVVIPDSVTANFTMIKWQDEKDMDTVQLQDAHPYSTDLSVEDIKEETTDEMENISDTRQKADISLSESSVSKVKIDIVNISEARPHEADLSEEHVDEETIKVSDTVSEIPNSEVAQMGLIQPCANQISVNKMDVLDAKPHKAKTVCESIDEETIKESDAIIIQKYESGQITITPSLQDKIKYDTVDILDAPTPEKQYEVHVTNEELDTASDQSVKLTVSTKEHSTILKAVRCSDEGTDASECVVEGVDSDSVSSDEGFDLAIDEENVNDILDALGEVEMEEETPAETCNVKDTSEKVSGLEDSDWSHYVSDASTNVAHFETDTVLSQTQAEDFLRHMLISHQTHEHQEGSQEHSDHRQGIADLSACLSDVCKATSESDSDQGEVAYEDKSSREINLVFAWPRKPGETIYQGKQPYRELHLKRVTRIKDFEIEVVEGPRIEEIGVTDVDLPGDTKSDGQVSQTASQAIPSSYDHIKVEVADTSDSEVSLEDLLEQCSNASSDLHMTGNTSDIQKSTRHFTF